MSNGRTRSGSRAAPLGFSLERDARRYLPAVIADLFADGKATIAEPVGRDEGYDFVATTGGRAWMFELKSSSSPGVIAHFADQVRGRNSTQRRTVLVVPHMSRAGAEAAARLGVNWLDLSGNASLRDRHTYVHVEGKPNRFPQRGRPASAFAPRSSRVARVMLLEPARWWVQKELAETTGLDAGRVSRIVKALESDHLLQRSERGLRPGSPDTLLDAWAEDYNFDHHEAITGHLSGNGMELAETVHRQLRGHTPRHAFTGLASAWLFEPFARFRLVTVYVDGDPLACADRIGMRVGDRGANVQLIAPDDDGVFDGGTIVKNLPCVSAVQTYLDLLALPERAQEAADHLRESGRLFDDRT